MAKPASSVPAFYVNRRFLQNGSHFLNDDGDLAL